MQPFFEEYDKRMERWNPNSEIGQALRRIEEECRAATWSLHGMAMGAARHEFITKRLENIGRCSEQLRELVGENEAMALVVQAMEQADEACEQ